MKIVASILIGAFGHVSAVYAKSEKILRKTYFTSEVFRISLLLWAIFILTSCNSPSGGEMRNKQGNSIGNLASGVRLMLRDGWQVQTSSGQPDGAAISKVGFTTSGWYPTVIPASVSGVLAQAGVYPDPFVGTNLCNWPGMGWGGARGASRSGTPQGNPFSFG